jgi:hypothetical protein
MLSSDWSRVRTSLQSPAIHQQRPCSFIQLIHLIHRVDPGGPARGDRIRYDCTRLSWIGGSEDTSLSTATHRGVSLCICRYTHSVLRTESTLTATSIIPDFQPWHRHKSSLSLRSSLLIAVLGPFRSALFSPPPAPSRLSFPRLDFL